MKEIIERLMALRSEANLIQEKIEKEMEDWETMGAPLYSVCDGIDSTIGAIMVQAYRDGNLVIN